MPTLKTYLDTQPIQVISARDRYEHLYPQEINAWKTLTFYDIAQQHQWQSMLGLGDQEMDRQALCQTCQSLGLVMKSIICVNDGTAQDLIRRLRFMYDTLYSIFHQPDAADIRLTFPLVKQQTEIEYSMIVPFIPHTPSVDNTLELVPELTPMYAPPPMPPQSTTKTTTTTQQVDNNSNDHTDISTTAYHYRVNVDIDESDNNPVVTLSDTDDDIYFQEDFPPEVVLTSISS
jgi:hypothetical protein